MLELHTEETISVDEELFKFLDLWKMYIKIRNTKYVYRLIETPDGRSYWLEWTDDQGLFRRQTISKWDADKNFQTGIWTYS